MGGWPNEKSPRSSGFGINQRVLPCSTDGPNPGGREDSKELGVKYDAGKVRMDLLDSYALSQLAAVLTMGANKYGDHNWRGGIRYSRVFGAALRHLFAWQAGE